MGCHEAHGQRKHRRVQYMCTMILGQNCSEVSSAIGCPPSGVLARLERVETAPVSNPARWKFAGSVVLQENTGTHNSLKVSGVVKAQRCLSFPDLSFAAMTSSPILQTCGPGKPRCDLSTLMQQDTGTCTASARPVATQPLTDLQQNVLSGCPRLQLKHKTGAKHVCVSTLVSRHKQACCHSIVTYCQWCVVGALAAKPVIANVCSQATPLQMRLKVCCTCCLLP